MTKTAIRKQKDLQSLEPFVLAKSDKNLASQIIPTS